MNIYCDKTWKLDAVENQHHGSLIYSHNEPINIFWHSEYSSDNRKFPVLLIFSTRFLVALIKKMPLIYVHGNQQMFFNWFDFEDTYRLI